MKRLYRTCMPIAACAALVGCDDEKILEGERFDVRTPVAVAFGLQEPEAADRTAVAAFRAEPPINPANWTHVNGNARHDVAHIGQPDELRPLWSARIGSGNAKRQRLSASPIIADGMIFVMDSSSRVTALAAATGDILWQTELASSPDSGSEASSGGLAVSDGTVFATTGFGTLSAVDAATGNLLWVQRFDAAAIGAPAVSGNKVYVVTEDSRAWAVDTIGGRLLWSIESSMAPVSVTGGLSPAIAGGNVFFPFPSGEIVAVEGERGGRLWSFSLGGVAAVGPQATLVGISSMPVVDGEVVYSGNHAGRLAAIDRETGETRWSLDSGSLHPALASGNRVFLVSEEAELLAVDAFSGQRIWSVQLPHHKSRRISRRKSVYVHFGPMMVAGRLMIVSSDGMLRQFSPSDGSEIASVDLPGDAAGQPAFAQGHMYLLTADGRLHAYH